MSGMRSIPLDDFDKLLDTLPTKLAAIAAIGTTTGCRIGEILLLRRFDVLTSEGMIRDQIPFPQLKTVDGKAKRRRNAKQLINKLQGDHRYMSLPEPYHKYLVAVLHIEELRGYCRPDDFVFRGKLGKPLSYFTVYRLFRQYLGSGHGTHWMRKTFAQEMFKYFLAQNQTDPMRALELTRRALNHARIDTTVKYLGIEETAVTDAQNAVFGRKGE